MPLYTVLGACSRCSAVVAAVKNSSQFDPKQFMQPVLLRRLKKNISHPKRLHTLGTEKSTPQTLCILAFAFGTVVVGADLES